MAGLAISLQLPALYWIHDRFRLLPLRHSALVLARLVVLRLVLNPDILDYTLGRVRDSTRSSMAMACPPRHS
jgi:hypothetical protein